MTGAQLAALIIQLGPIALDWAGDLAEVWNKDMTPEEVRAFCLGKRKSYDEYKLAEIARRAGLGGE
jgi:hypothetical protein